MTGDGAVTAAPAAAPAAPGAAQLDGPLARHLSEDERVAISERTGARPGDLVLMVSDQYRTACEVLGTLRTMLGSPPVAQGPHHYVWVVDFPMFEGVGADGHLQAAHHPFTMPYPEDLDLLESEPLAVRSQAYDLVLNGWELGSGSVRIHRSDMQARVFAALGIGPEEAEARFGFLLGAFRYGAPPHAGFAFGVDRLAAILAGEENIREVIAYPKTQSGADPLTGAPKPLPAEALAELGIRVVVPPTIAAAGAAMPPLPPMPPAPPARRPARRARTKRPTPHRVERFASAGGVGPGESPFSSPFSSPVSMPTSFPGRVEPETGTQRFRLRTRTRRLAPHAADARYPLPPRPIPRT